MEDETVQFLRQTNRTQLLLHRRKLRDEESDSRRSNFRYQRNCYEMIRILFIQQIIT